MGDCVSKKERPSSLTHFTHDPKSIPQKCSPNLEHKRVVQLPSPTTLRKITLAHEDFTTSQSKKKIEWVSAQQIKKLSPQNRAKYFDWYSRQFYPQHMTKNKENETLKEEESISNNRPNLLKPDLHQGQKMMRIMKEITPPSSKIVNFRPTMSEYTNQKSSRKEEEQQQQ